MEAWRDAVLREMDHKHRAEQELLVTIVMDEGSEDVRDAARKMGKEGRQKRLLFLRSQAEGLNLEKKGMYLEQEGEGYDFNWDFSCSQGRAGTKIRRLLCTSKSLWVGIVQIL